MEENNEKIIEVLRIRIEVLVAELNALREVTHSFRVLRDEYSKDSTEYVLYKKLTDSYDYKEHIISEDIKSIRSSIDAMLVNSLHVLITESPLSNEDKAKVREELALGRYDSLDIRSQIAYLSSKE